MDTHRPLNIVHLSDYAPPAYLVDSIELTFDLDPQQTRVRAKSFLRRNPAAGNDAAPLELDGEGLTLDLIQVDGIDLPPDRYTVGSERLVIKDVPGEFELIIETSVCPSENKSLEGLYLTSMRFCTQCEAEGFRRITYFLDRPDVLARYRVELRAEKEKFPTLLSNGNCIAKKDLDGGRHSAVWEDPFPKPSYLFALVAGDLERLTRSYETASQKAVSLNLYVEHGKKNRASFALDSLERAMVWDEKTYGLEYDLDEFNIVAVSDFNMGAMENKSLNIFNEKYILADPETATDVDYEWIEAIVAHEYFHNWTGNRVTCRDWFQLSLKEGLTVFREQQFSADMRSAAVKRIEDVSVLRATQFLEDNGPLAHPVRPESYSEINNFYTHTVYEKGAEVVRMIHTIAGEEAFRRGMDLYFERHDGQAVTCEDFVQAMTDASGYQFDQFMLWYKQAGTPVIQAQGQFDAETGTYILELKQKNRRQHDGQKQNPFSIPLQVGFIDGDNGPVETDIIGKTIGQQLTHTLMIENETTEVCFSGFQTDGSVPLISLNRGFSAPVIVEIERTHEDLGSLIAHDPDSFVRWDSMQELTIELLLGEISGERNEASLSAYEKVIPEIISRAKVNPAETALMLSLPNEAVISDRLDVIDPIAIFEARQWLYRQVLEKNQSSISTLFDTFKVGGPYTPSADDGGKRALSNKALQFLVHARSGEGIRSAFAHYEMASDMTNRWAALLCLNDLECDQRSDAMAYFHERYAEDPLVLDKWFSLEAMSARPGTLPRVQNLLNHPKYDQKNPNRIRALIGTFALKNATAFHDQSGSGYSFVADQIIEIDAFNPQVAARLAGSFQKWKRFDKPRQALMQDELVRMSRHKNASKDLLEIVSKSLDVD